MAASIPPGKWKTVRIGYGLCSTPASVNRMSACSSARWKACSTSKQCGAESSAISVPGAHARIQTTEEGGDEIQSGVIEQECAFAGGSHGLKPSSNGPRLFVQLRVGQARLLDLAILEKGVGGFVGLVLRSVMEEFDQGCVRLDVIVVGSHPV